MRNIIEAKGKFYEVEKSMNNSYWCKVLRKDLQPDVRKRYNTFVRIADARWVEGSPESISEIKQVVIN